MLMKEPTPAMLAQWKETYKTYRPKLAPNRKTTEEILAYLEERYPIKEVTDERAKQVVTDNILLNEFFSQKAPKDKALEPVVYLLEDTGAGEALHKTQDEVFSGCLIIIGLEKHTGYLMVEGSSYLYDELTAFAGLDAYDIENAFCLSQYIDCLRRFGLLEQNGLS